MNIDDADFDENLTFQQLINAYNADSTLLNTEGNPGNITNQTIDTADNDTDINISPVQTGERDDPPFNLEEDFCLTDRTTKSLRQHIEKVCYCHSEWHQKLIFCASLDQTT